MELTIDWSSLVEFKGVELYEFKGVELAWADTVLIAMKADMMDFLIYY